jgi:hypothetical protein
VLDGEFGANVARVLVPFPVMLGLIGLLYIALPDSPAPAPKENPDGRP